MSRPPAPCHTAPAQRWDLWCRVVDNYGDAGVCWRLARQLAAEYGLAVQLWIDRPEALARLQPGIDPARPRQHCAGVDILRWDADSGASPPGAVLIEAFACELPVALRAQLAVTRPLWINLEYLSAEDWIDGCHGLPSPQAGGVAKYFYFPGFTPASGGLICEATCRRARAAWDETAARGWLAAHGIDARGGERRLSLFAYEQAALGEWLEQLASGEPWLLLVPEGRILEALGAWAGQPLAAGSRYARGALRLAVLPFLDQDDYDRLLWSCTLNAVRGEDSFVRAQWARRPLLWQAYRQAQDAHFDKLDAWLQRWLAGLDAGVADATRRFQLAWNRERDVAAAWPEFAAVLPALEQHAAGWAEQLLHDGDLAAKLVQFTASRLG